MPISEPGKILHVKDLDELSKTLNFIHSDIYSLFDKVFGYGGKTLTPDGLAIPDGSVIVLANTGLHIQSLAAAYELIIKPGSTLTADRTLTITTGDANRTIVISGNTVLDDWFDQSVKVAAGPTFDHAHVNTIMCSNLSSGHIPYHDTDALGLDDTNLWTDGTNLGIGMDSANNLIQVSDLINFNNTLYNTFLGYEAGKNTTSGCYDVFVGYGAGKTNTSGQQCTAVGYLALNLSTNSHNNTVVGYKAGAVLTGSGSVFIGDSAGVLTQNSSGNTAVGSGSQSENISGAWNSSFGYQAGKSVTGSSNTYIGASAGTSLGNESSNVCVGDSSGNTVGSYNTFLGANSGGSAGAASDRNISIGYYAGSRETGADTLLIDNRLRVNEANGRTQSIIYGIMAALPEDQYLTFNANVTISETLTMTGGITVPTLKVTTSAALGSILVSDTDGDLTYTAVGAAGTYLAGSATVPAYATLNQAAVAGLTTADGPTFDHIHLTTNLDISEGGTGQSTAQAAIDVLTAVAGATNEHVLTKDTATGNAIFKVAAGGYVHPNHSGDVTSIADGAQTIAAKAVHITMLADGTDGELITWDSDGVAAVVAVGTASHVLTSNGIGAAPTFQAATGVSDGDKGDITVSGSGATWTIDAGVVTLAKMANMDTASLIYRKTAGAGAPEVNTLATLKTDLALAQADISGLTTADGPTFDHLHLTGSATLASIIIGANTLDTNEWAALDGIHSAWTSFVPTWTNVTVGNAVQFAYYKKVGTLVMGYLSFTFGTTTSVTGDIIFMPPVTRNTNNVAPINFVRVVDVDSGGFIIGQWLGGRLRSYKMGTTYLVEEVMDATHPFTWAVNDIIWLSFEYEAA